MAIVDVLNQNKIEIETLFIDQSDCYGFIIGCNKDYLVLANKKSCLIIYKIQKNQVGLTLNQFSFISQFKSSLFIYLGFFQVTSTSS